MVALKNVLRRRYSIKYAGGGNEDVALLLQQMAELMMSYNGTVSPVRRVTVKVNLPLVTIQ